MLCKECGSQRDVQRFPLAGNRPGEWTLLRQECRRFYSWRDATPWEPGPENDPHARP